MTTAFRPGRTSVANGERIFNTRQFTFPGIPGHLHLHRVSHDHRCWRLPVRSPDNAAPNASLFVRYGLDSPEFLAHLRTS